MADEEYKLIRGYGVTDAAVHDSVPYLDVLPEEQKKMNKMKSKVRCRIEHVFGAMKSRCRDEVLRSIGFSRARFWIGLGNLVYNLGRFVSLKCPKPVRVR